MSVKWGITTTPDVKSLRSDIKDLGPDGKKWDRALGKANKELANVIAQEGQNRALAMGGVQARAASQIKGSQSAKGIRLRISNAGHPEALAAFWGGKQRTGWNAGNDAPNLPDWVGNAWKVGQSGEGPYAINDAVRVKRDEVMASWAKAINKLAEQVGS